jgi:hypothetical protein
LQTVSWRGSFQTQKSLGNNPQAFRQQVTYGERKYALLAHALIYQQDQMVSTVKIHVEHILAKLGVSDRTQAAVRAVELGLLDTVSRE